MEALMSDEGLTLSPGRAINRTTMSRFRHVGFSLCHRFMSQFLFPALEDASLAFFWLRNRIDSRAFLRDRRVHVPIALTRAVLAQRQLQEGRRLLQERDRQRHLFAGVSQNLHLRGLDTENRKIKASVRTHCSSLNSQFRVEKRQLASRVKKTQLIKRDQISC